MNQRPAFWVAQMRVGHDAEGKGIGYVYNHCATTAPFRATWRSGRNGKREPIGLRMLKPADHCAKHSLVGGAVVTNVQLASTSLALAAGSGNVPFPNRRWLVTMSAWSRARLPRRLLRWK